MSSRFLDLVGPSVDDGVAVEVVDSGEDPIFELLFGGDAAIEPSEKSWVVAVMHPSKDQPSIHRIKGGACSDLLLTLRAAARGGERLLVCYEAGYEGFWLARALKAEGLACQGLDPASQVNRRRGASKPTGLMS